MSESASKPSKHVLLIVFLTVFIDLIGFGIIIPIQPFFAEALGASPATVTLLGASYSLMQFLFAPFWGALSDRFGRRPIILVSLGTGFIGYLLFGFSHSLVALFGSRMLAGFGAANIGTAQAMIADSTTKADRAKGMGLIGAAFGLGFIFGPALGGIFGQFGMAMPAFVAAGLCAANWLFAFFRLPETLPVEARAKAGSARVGLRFSTLRRCARHTDVTRLFGLYLGYTLAFAMMEQVMGLFIEHYWVHSVPGAVGHAKHAAALTTFVLVVVGITATFVQGGLIGRLAKRMGERKLLVLGTACVATSFLAIPFIGTTGFFALLLVDCVLMAFGQGLTTPSLSSLLSQAVDEEERGGALGVGQSLSALGRVVGPSAAGLLFQSGAGLPFFVGGGLLFLCTGLSATLRNRGEGAGHH